MEEKCFKWKIINEDKNLASVFYKGKEIILSYNLVFGEKVEDYKFNLQWNSSDLEKLEEDERVNALYDFCEYIQNKMKSSDKMKVLPEGKSSWSESYVFSETPYLSIDAFGNIVLKKENGESILLEDIGTSLKGAVFYSGFDKFAIKNSLFFKTSAITTYGDVIVYDCENDDDFIEEVLNNNKILPANIYAMKFNDNFVVYKDFENDEGLDVDTFFPEKIQNSYKILLDDYKERGYLIKYLDRFFCVLEDSKSEVFEVVGGIYFLKVENKKIKSDILAINDAIYCINIVSEDFYSIKGYIENFY